MTIGSFICARNAIDLDYCLELGIESLLAFCDELVLCDSDSTDGTRQLMQRWADKDSRVRVINMPWTDPKGVSHEHWKQWIRFAQSHLKSPWCFYVDSDETVDPSPECISAIKEAAKHGKCITVDRINYWRSPQEVVPEGHCCARWVTRGGPTKYPCISDWPIHPGEEPIVDNAVKDPRIKIHHLGFLREKQAFYRKAKSVLSIWFNRFDPRLEIGEKENKPVWETECDFTNLLVPYTGTHPEPVQRWLADRGHFTEKYVPLLHEEPDPVIEVQELKPTHQPWGILHYGDFGDIIHMLPICKALGSVNLYFDDRNSICKRIKERLHILLPLLESQSYVGLAKPHEGETVNWKAGEFRQNHSKEWSLAYSHWLHYTGQKHMPKVSVDLSQPWITGIAPDPRTRNKVVFARSPRYHNHYFRWKALADHYRGASVFIGHPDEHRKFQEAFGEVEHIPTRDMLEVAQLIAGSDLFIGNQSAPMAIAEGMKHPRVMEVCPWQPDVVVEKGDKATMSADGALKLPPLAGKPELTLGSGLHALNYMVQTSLCPRRGWHTLFKEFPASSFNALKKQMAAGRSISPEEAHKIIIDRLHEVDPSYFPQTSPSTGMGMFDRAIANIKTVLQ